jgi:hypothetical protein
MCVEQLLRTHRELRQASVEAQGNNPQETRRLLATAASMVERLRTASSPAQNNSIWNGILEITAQERTRLTIRP